MPDPTLTICIPSHARLDQTRHAVQVLLPQLQLGRAHLLVLDNASPVDYEAALSADASWAAALRSGLVAVHRHPVNIGMSANFMRAFEHARGDWLWLLSDDDRIRHDAVQRAMAAIDEDGARHGFIKFSSARSRPRAGREELGSLEAFIDFNARSVHDFNGFLFISNGLYRLRNFRPLSSVGYAHAHTYIPHFMMLTAYMAQGNTMIVRDEEIVDYVVPDVGYSYGLVAGLGVGAQKRLLLKVDRLHHRRYLALFFPHNDYKVIIDLYFHCKRDATTPVCVQLVREYLQLAGAARSWWRLLPPRALATLVRFPTAFEWVVGRIAARGGRLEKHIDEIRKRYAPVPSAGSR